MDALKNMMNSTIRVPGWVIAAAALLMLLGWAI